MAVRDMAYVELFTSDERVTVDYFVSAMGFSREAKSTDHDRSSVLLRQGEVRLVVSSGPATWKFLDAHGDGIADLAMTCDDVARTRDEAVAAGADVVESAAGHPVVSGFGGVSHTLLPDADADADADAPATGLLADRRWNAEEAPREAVRPYSIARPRRGLPAGRNARRVRRLLPGRPRLLPLFLGVRGRRRAGHGLHSRPQCVGARHIHPGGTGPGQGLRAARRLSGAQHAARAYSTWPSWSTTSSRRCTDTGTGTWSF